MTRYLFLQSGQVAPLGHLPGFLGTHSSHRSASLCPPLALSALPHLASFSFPVLLREHVPPRQPHRLSSPDSFCPLRWGQLTCCCSDFPAAALTPSLPLLPSSVPAPPLQPGSFRAFLFPSHRGRGGHPKGLKTNCFLGPPLVPPVVHAQRKPFPSFRTQFLLPVASCPKLSAEASDVRVEVCQ